MLGLTAAPEIVIAVAKVSPSGAAWPWSGSTPA